MKRSNMSRRRTPMCIELITYNVEGVRLCVHVDARTEGKTVQCGSGAARRMAAGGDVAALESGVGQVRSGRYHRLCAPPSTDFHFPSVTPPRSGSGWRHQPPSLRRFPILNVRRKTSSELLVHSRIFQAPRTLYRVEVNCRFEP